jgi:tetratricopeptide (TPR) repeat protein
MSIRFSSAYSTLRSAAVALVLLCAGAPAWAQYDAITREAQKDPFILVRLAALSLETPAEQGEALAGLVEAELARGRLKDALEELERIEDGFWRATALLELAHYNAGKYREKQALKALRDASRALKGKVKGADAIALMGRIANAHAGLGDAAGAVAAAKRIPDRMIRIQSLLETGLVGTVDEAGKPIKHVKASKGARLALAEAYRQTSSIKDDDSEAAGLLLYIGGAQTRLGDHKNAAVTLRQARRMIEKKKFAGRDEALAELAAAETQAGDQSRAMRLVRSIADPERRVRALGSVARAIAEKGNMDAAITLFTLAVETTPGIEEDDLRYELLTHLVVEQSRVGRLADAFKTAGLIRDPAAQADALFAMGQVLLGKHKFEEALRLTDYIPYLGLRAQILADVALWRGEVKSDSVAASALLAKSLEPMQRKPVPARVEAALEKVLDTQIKVGDPKTTEALFDRAKGLIETLPGGLNRVRLLTLLARAYARSEDPDRSADVIKAARRITLNRRRDPDYPRSAARIVEALIASDQILESFNAAARIPEVEVPENQRASQMPRNRALKNVAEAAARIGKPQLAIRAARKIRDPASRAAALAAVARGMAQAEQ